MDTYIAAGNLVMPRAARPTARSRSPIGGTVPRRNIGPGQFAPAEPRAAAMIVGDLSSLLIRAQVDEEDVLGLRKGAAAVARVRGPAAATVDLDMVRIEPFASPKTELTGATIERVDTRVVEVVFRIKGTPGVTLYPGQRVDVFIDGAAPAPSGGMPHGP